MIQLLPGESSFVSDCGAPSIYKEPLVCDNCTLCCTEPNLHVKIWLTLDQLIQFHFDCILNIGNSADDCYPNKTTLIQEAGFRDYTRFSLIFLSLIVVGCCILRLVSSCYWRNTGNAQLNTSNPQDLIKAIDREKEYALDLIGRDSVYRYFLSESWIGWGIALGTVAAQSALIYVFIDASEIKFSTDVDIEYTWECPRDELQCRNTTGTEEIRSRVYSFLFLSLFMCVCPINEFWSFRGLGVTYYGWIAYALLITAHIVKDGKLNTFALYVQSFFINFLTFD